MKNNITELVFIIDRSGSMANLEKDTIGGFNSMIKQQKEKEGKCYVSTVLFDHEAKVLHDRIKLKDVKEMTDSDYCVRGCTALLDALGDSINHISNIHKYARKEAIPENTMFIITTDGMENASRRFDSETIKQLISEKKEKHGWEFIFIGANIDAVNTAKTYGIDESNAVNYNADKTGTEILYSAVNEAVENIRACKPLSQNWRKQLDKDFKNRNRR